MNINIGTDIIEIERIKMAIETDNNFVTRVFTDNEIKYCNQRNKQRYQSYAARFAAKEAIYKALSNKINFEYFWKDFEILNDKSGRPYVNLKFELENLEQIDISLSHCKEYAVAYATAIFKE